MVDQVGIWVSIGIMCGACMVLILFAVFKQYVIGITLPDMKRQKVQQTTPGKISAGDEPSDAAVNADRVDVKIAEEACSAVDTPHVYEQMVELETST